MASAGGLFPMPIAPVYAASKVGNLLRRLPADLHAAYTVSSPT